MIFYKPFSVLLVMRIPILLLTCLLWFTCRAQDSIMSRRIFISETQTSLSPSLVSQFGKHVIRTDVVIMPEQSIEHSLPVTYSQFAYQTQMGKYHGVGVYYSRNNSKFLLQTQTGFQYGLKVRLAQQGIFRNTDLGLGITLGIGTEKAHTENLVFHDQFDSTVITRPTVEPLPTASSITPIAHASVNLIGNRAYLLVSFQNIIHPDPGLYVMSSEPVDVVIAPEAGIKIITVKRFSCWGVMGYGFSKDRTAYIGGTIQYDNRFAYHFKYRNFSPPYNTAIEQQVSYTANRIRAYASYTFKPERENFVPLATFRLGLALSIVKK